jgi:hypothetical protein
VASITTRRAELANWMWDLCTTTRLGCPIACGHLILVMRAHLDALDHGSVGCGLDLVEAGPDNREGRERAP